MTPSPPVSDRMLTADVHVCSLARMPHVVAANGASYLVSAINRDMLPATPPTIAANRHLRLAMNDISAARDGLVLPGGEHVQALIDFVQRWDHDGPLVIHCWAGISRSTAGAYIALCALNPAGSELDIARRLREASPSATPNPRLISLADAQLGRDGRMIDAIARIGRGENAMEGIPFRLASRQA